MTATSDSSLARPAGLWKSMPDAERRLAAEAFWADSESIVEQAEVMALIARKLNFRFKSVQTMATERKVKHLMALGNVSDGVAGRLLVSYHLTHQRPMMGAFLDALGIEHDNGLIAQDTTPTPDPEKLASAATAVRGAFPAPAVDLYFAVLAMQDPETWGGVKGL